MILLDCPNLKDYKDSFVLAGAVDAVILIIKEGKTRIPALKVALSELKTKATLAGAILSNRAFDIPDIVYKIT